jgi:hypothetical protein
MVVHSCNPFYLTDGGRRILVGGKLGKSTRLYLKNKLQQIGLGARGMAQVVEHLVSERKAPSSQHQYCQQRQAKIRGDNFTSTSSHCWDLLVNYFVFIFIKR